MKSCTNPNCKQSNPQSLLNFNKSKNHSDGLAYWCKNCSYEKTQEWKNNNRDKVRKIQSKHYKNYAKSISDKAKAFRLAHPDKAKNTQLKHDFGITIIDYNQMFKDQNGCCAICNKHVSEFNKALAVDHCHKTEKIRGLLCNNCNTGLGKFKDDIDLITKAIKYLEEKKEKK